MNCMALEAQLAAFDITIDQMSSGVKAVAHLKQLLERQGGSRLYRVILCDFSMPKLDGP